MRTTYIESYRCIEFFRKRYNSTISYKERKTIAF